MYIWKRKKWFNITGLIFFARVRNCFDQSPKLINITIFQNKSLSNWSFGLVELGIHYKADILFVKNMKLFPVKSINGKLFSPKTFFRQVF